MSIKSALKNNTVIVELGGERCAQGVGGEA
jgi:hypothetical protein